MYLVLIFQKSDLLSNSKQVWTGLSLGKLYPEKIHFCELRKRA